MKLLSIIIPIYNAGLYIKTCIDSLYQQGMEENTFETILVNDGSTDNSLQIITDIQQCHTNIIIISHQNQGISASRNQGIQHAQGKYILFVDSDDVLIPDTLPHFIACAQQHDTDIVRGQFIKLNDNEIEHFDYRVTNPPAYLKADAPIKTGEQAFIENYMPNESYIWNCLYKRDFILKHTLYFIEEHIYFEDIPFAINSLLKCQRFLALPITSYIYRQRENSIVSTMNKNKLYSMNKVIQYLYSLLRLNELSDKTKKKLKDCIFFNLSINLWYLSHYRSLYPHRKEIANDLKRKIPGLFFHRSGKQLFVGLCFRYIPSLYLGMRYYCTRIKY